MRSTRIVILFFFLAACFFVLVRSVASSARTNHNKPANREAGKSSVWSYVYYNAPFSLFPPNAAISLTDDNSTSFAARPAAFGPRLAQNGLSGQLWVGSGFAEDTLDGDGELGCSDLPGRTRAALKNSFKAASHRLADVKSKLSHLQQDESPFSNTHVHDDADDDDQRRDVVQDGTDNFLRHDAPGLSSHADIQSIQEAAEIEGKIVLLMRGGCGFLEKVMWAQRRGAIAVIVGDNDKGGPLIQMFAHGDDVENVTIPSVFTARTTAQLLSSLTQPGSFIEDILDDSGKAVFKVQQGVKPSKKKPQIQSKAKPVTSPKDSLAPPKGKRGASDKGDQAAAKQIRKPGLVSRALKWRRSARPIDDKSRPPRSGHLDWVVVEDWDEENDKMLMDSMSKGKKPSQNAKPVKDDFVIGVQDWRDPDLVDRPDAGKNKDTTTSKKAGQKVSSNANGGRKGSTETNEPKGGSITPGSGEYSSGRRPVKAPAEDVNAETTNSGHGLISKFFGDRDGEDDGDDDGSDSDDRHPNPVPPPDDPSTEPHEGLWVTITPTSSASPFFDTLLVLVISPLITLTIVYALLVLRARIRRRRWRAPKSVVERLPIRTYHTVASTPNAATRAPSPSNATVTTPLLQHQQSQSLQQTPVRPRPRSRTTTGIPESEGLLVTTPTVRSPRSDSRNTQRGEREKATGGFSAEWKKYMGRQVECVVCLEEYIDGVSKVMSLPCGHEFHADCITPWLTTRRRTCPICKGDVVRSMARGSSSNPRYEPYRDDSDSEDPDVEASGSRSPRRDADLERGILSPEPHDSRSAYGPDGFFGYLTSRFGTRARSRSPSPEPHDRSR